MVWRVEAQEAVIRFSVSGISKSNISAVEGKDSAEAWCGSGIDEFAAAEWKSSYQFEEGSENVGLVWMGNDFVHWSEPSGYQFEVC